MQEEYLSQRAFAALPEVGVSHVRINKLIKEGRIPTNADGKIPKNAGIEAWKTCRVVGFEKAAAAGAKYGGDPKKTKNRSGMTRSVDDDEPVDSTDLGARYNKAKTLEKEEMARKRRFENDVEEGKYVLKSDVRAEASELAGSVKQKLISIAPIIAVTAEGKTATQIQKIVEKHINEALGMLQELEI